MGSICSISDTTVSTDVPTTTKSGVYQVSGAAVPTNPAPTPVPVIVPVPIKVAPLIIATPTNGIAPHIPKLISRSPVSEKLSIRRNKNNRSLGTGTDLPTIESGRVSLPFPVRAFQELHFPTAPNVPDVKQPIPTAHIFSREVSVQQQVMSTNSIRATKNNLQLNELDWPFIVYHLPTPILFVDEGLTVLWCNDAAETVFGIDRGENKYAHEHACRHVVRPLERFDRLGHISSHFQNSMKNGNRSNI